MPKLLINGLQLYYVSEGEGPAVILMHELGGSTESWAKLRPDLAAAGFRAVAVDLRGAGESEVPRAPYSMEDVAADVLAVMDALSIQRAFLVGMAVGAFAVMQTAISGGQRVRGMVLIDAALAMPEHAIPWARERCNIIMRSGMAAVVDGTMVRSFPPPVSEAWQAAMATYRARFLKNDPRGYTLASEAAFKADFRTTATDIMAPALVMTGERDLPFPPEHGEIVARALPHADFQVIPGAAHFPPIQAPEAVSAAIIPFLQRCTAQEEGGS